MVLDPWLVIICVRTPVTLEHGMHILSFLGQNKPYETEFTLIYTQRKGEDLPITLINICVLSLTITNDE